MSEPILMPFQDLPFNGDTFVQEQFLKLKEKFNINFIVETGSCLYSTTKWLGDNFDNVYSIEINPEFAKHGIHKVQGMLNVCPVVGVNSVDYLNEQILSLSSISIEKFNIMYFLDAHWLENCPLLEELEAIAKITKNRESVCNIKNIDFQKPVIAIHDFLVPDVPELGYDSIHGQPFTYEWIKPYLEMIYGVDGYEYYYNTAEQSTEVKRGLIYITPKK